MHLAGHRAQLLRLGRGERHRLFAQHMFAGLRCQQGQGHMLLIGQGDVDRFDARIGQQFFVTAIGSWYA